MELVEAALILGMSFGGPIYDSFEDRLQSSSGFVGFRSGCERFFEPVIGDVVERAVRVELPALIANLCF